MIQKEENVKKRINLQEIIIKAENNIKNYQILFDELNKKNNSKFQNKNIKEDNLNQIKINKKEEEGHLEESNIIK